MRTLIYKFNFVLTHYLIYNPVAGTIQRNPDLIPTVLEALRSDGAPVVALPTTGPDSAQEIARDCARKGSRRVYVAGGDGTINEVVNGLAGSHTELGVLPGGTANCLAVELGIGMDMHRAATQAATWQPHRIALGLCKPDRGQPRYFTVMAGAGVDAQIVNDVNPKLKRKVGKLAYWIAGLSSSLRVLPELDVKTSSGTMRVTFALASRVKNYGGDLEIAKTIRLTEPYFETVLFEGRFAVKYLKYLAGVIVNRHRGMAGVHVEHTDRLHLAAANGNPIYLQLDGEAYGELPAHLEIVPDSLTLLMPKKG